MSWVIAIAVVAVIIGLLTLMIREGGGRNVGRDGLPDLARLVLIQCENGGFKRFDDRNSDVWFSLERLSGTDTSAVLALRIPRIERAVAVADDLRKVYVSNGFEWSDEGGNPSLLARVLIPVDNIWAKASGAKGAHAVRLFLDTLGVSKKARFNIEVGGYPSNRWKHRDISEL